MSSNVEPQSQSPPQNINIATFTWKLFHYSTFRLIYEYSSKFSSGKDPNIKFYLKFYPKNVIRGLENYSMIYLKRNMPFDGVDVEVKYRLSILDQFERKCLTKELHASFLTANETEPMYTGLYIINRDYLLDAANLLTYQDTLTIYCEVEIVDSNKKAETNENFDKISQDFSHLLENGANQFSDVTFVVNSREFALHKNILSCRCPVFGVMFSGNYKERAESRFEIADMEVNVFEQMIRYIYTGKVTEQGLELYAEDLFVAADKYQLDVLQNIAADKLSKSLSIESVSRILLLADMHNATQLKGDCLQYITKHSDQVIVTEGWKRLVEIRLDLMVHLYRQIANDK